MHCTFVIVIKSIEKGGLREHTRVTREWNSQVILTFHSMSIPLTFHSIGLCSTSKTIKDSQNRHTAFCQHVDLVPLYSFVNYQKTKQKMSLQKKNRQHRSVYKGSPLVINPVDIPVQNNRLCVTKKNLCNHFQ